MPRRPSTVDEYLVTVTGQRRAALARLRMTIRALLPEAEECISYGMPAFRLRGRVVAGFAATAGGGSYYPFSGATLATLAGELGDRGRTKSALHFRADDPLPASLVRKLLQARMAEIPEPHGAAGRAAKGARSAGRKGRERGT